MDQNAVVKELVSRIQDEEEVLEYAKNIATAVVAGPHNHCAATLSALLIFVGIFPVGGGRAAGDLEPYVPTLARDLEEIKGWTRIALDGDISIGDVGVVLVDDRTHHIYLVLDPRDQKFPLIADNQAGGPHTRGVAGEPKKNFSPTNFFLRAPAGEAIG